MPVEHPMVREGAVTLRKYQEGIVARALGENTLVVLPTGLGKTVIAAMVAAHRLHEHRGSRVLFLAPTKPLAVQHMRSLQGLLNVEGMCVLTGAEAPEKRRALWAASRIIFATPQTIENDIVRGLDLSDVSLLVFDEAHRAVGDYSYVSIAREYLGKARLPMTLGLTASPSSERATVEEICGNLRVTLVEAKSESDPDVREYVQPVKVHWVRVDLPEGFRRVQALLRELLRRDLKRLKEQGYIDSADVARVAKTALLKAQSAVRADIASGGDAFQAASAAASALKVNHAVELLETQGVAALREYLGRLETQGTKAVKSLFRDEDMLRAREALEELRRGGVEHPKLAELARIVGGYRGRKVLIFTQYRDSVEAIISCLNASDILAHEFIGQASRGLKSGMTQKRQVEVLDRFREGKYTALVATSVAEEGLDIPKVDAVVFYEPVPSEIRAIQRRGRTGRSATGEVYVMMAKGTRDEAYYWVSVHKERKMAGIVDEMRKGAKPRPGTGASTAAAKETAYGQQSLVSFGAGEGGRLKVYVDSRERNGAILSALRDSCDIELRQLPVGDYLVSDRVCVERKTMDDFLGSLIDRRLMAQAAEMRRNFDAPVIVLEKVDRLYSQRNIHPNAVRGALASLSIDFRIPIIPSEDEEDTAQIILALARREQQEGGRAVALRGERKPELLHERQRFIVESLPSVSAVLADRLLARFGSVRGVMSAGEKQLREVDGIGEKKAAEIVKAVRESYGRGKG